MSRSMEHNSLHLPSPLPAGKATIKLDFAYDGGGRGKGGKATLSVNGTKVAEGRVENTHPNMFLPMKGLMWAWMKTRPLPTPTRQARKAGSRARSTK
jgi:hypothetical protein